jgi:hypothetical protein
MAVLALSGCATLSVEEPISQLEAEVPKPAVQKVAKSTFGKARSRDSNSSGETAEPGWHRVVYRGRVDWDGVLERPIAGATVSVYDGQEELCSTVADGKGQFELACDLYGTPQEDWKGRTAWKPESYYSIIAEAPTGGFVKQRLQKVDMRKAIHLEVTPP